MAGDALFCRGVYETGCDAVLFCLHSVLSHLILSAREAGLTRKIVAE